MEEDKIEIPEFMQKYYSGSDAEGQEILKNLASSYKNQRQDYMMKTHATQANIHKTLYGGSSKEINPEIGFASIKEEFKTKAEKIALGNGYIEPQHESKSENTSTRQEFLNRLSAMRENKPKNDPKVVNHVAQSNDNTATTLNRREQFLANMKSMRERQTLVCRPRH